MIMSDRLRFDILTSDTALAKSLAEDTAAGRRIATPSNRLKIDFALIAWKCFAEPSKSKLRVLVGWENNEIVLVWPFGVKGRSAFWLGGGNSYRDIIFAESPSTHSWVRTAWLEAKTTLGVDVIKCPRVKDDNVASEILKAEEGLVLDRLEAPSLKLDGFEDWESYEQTLSGKFRRDLRRRQKRLSDKGTLNFQLLEDRQAVESALEWTFRQKERWAHRKSVSLDLGNQIRDFYGAVALTALPADALLFGVLKLEDTILATAFGVADGRWAEILISTYDRDWKAYSPGNLLFAQMIRWALERKLTVLDFGIGNEPYKQYFANSGSAIGNYVVPCTGRGRIFIALYFWPRKQLSVLFRRLPSALQARIRDIVSTVSRDG